MTDDVADDPLANPDGAGVDAGRPVAWRELHDQTVARLLTAADRRGDPDASSTARAEARWLIERAAGDPYPVIAAVPATVRSHHHWRLMLERRESGEPLQYVLAQWPFRELDLFIDRRVLIPRPETEIVAGAAIEHHRRVGGMVLDLGTGSGAIALSVAVERPGTDVWGVEHSPDALAVARANCTGIGRRARTVRLVEGSWFEPLPRALHGKFGVIVSNPPYVTATEALPAVVEAWEPVTALRAGDDGLDDIRVIVAGAQTWLAPGGALIIEHAPGQADAVRALAEAAGFSQVRTGTDLTGRDRYLHAV